MFLRRAPSLYFFLCILFSSPAFGNDSPETLLFREALKDPFMQRISREAFSNDMMAVACAVLSLQWRSGRIMGSTPLDPQDSEIPLIMHGMAETSLYALGFFSDGERVDYLTQRALRLFEESQEFREGIAELCLDAMIAPLGYVTSKYLQAQ